MCWATFCNKPASGCLSHTRAFDGSEGWAYGPGRQSTRMDALGDLATRSSFNFAFSMVAFGPGVHGTSPPRLEIGSSCSVRNLEPIFGSAL